VTGEPESIPASAFGHRRRSVVNDNDLRDYVIQALEFEPSIDAADIGVTAENGIVTLSGHVSDFPQKRAAERAAWRVKGVRGIAQHIEVRLPGHKRRADDEIAQRAISILAWSAQVPADAVRVRAADGWITLLGKVDWDYQRRAAESAVRQLSGVVGVHNEITLVHSAIDVADIRHGIDGALRRHARLESERIRVDVSGGTVTLGGEVDSWDERQAILRAAWSVGGVTAVVDGLTVR
jgi:osmotically-inducible protein OsmY